MHALKCTYIVMYIAMYMCHVCLKLLYHACRIHIKMTIFMKSTDDDHGDESVHNDDVGSCYKAMLVLI